MPHLSYRTIVIIYFFWWFCCASLQAFALHATTGISWERSAQDGFISAAAMALAGYVILNMVRFYNLRYAKFTIMLAWAVALALAAVFASRYLLGQFFYDDAFYLEVLTQSLIIRLTFASLLMILIGMIGGVYFYLKEAQESDLRKTESEKLVKDAELSRLRQQLQPHFLFNSLNSVSALIGTRPEEARKMIQQLSDFLRGTVRKDDHHLVSLDEEMNHLQLYLEIEKVRFGHRLNTDIEIPSDARASQMPSLLLQPVVENAIKFGLYDTLEPITILLRAGITDNHLVVRVENPFDPQTTQPKGTGFGLTSVQRRLYLLYARNDLLTTRTSDNTFITEIKIPQIL